MKNKLNIIKCFILIFISALTLSGCSLMDILFPTEEVEKFSFSGYVFADDVALPQATVSCGISETITDDRGYYSFSGLTKVVQVQVAKEGYYFDDSLVYVKSNRNDVNFEGNKFFDVSGIVKNGEECVIGADVSVTSSAGTVTTVTNEQGNFYLPYLAGLATISASYKDIEFFSQEVNSETGFVTINSYLNLTGSIICDEEATADDFTLKINNSIYNNAIIGNGKLLTFNLKNIAPNSSITLESNSYYIEDNSVIINKDDEISFNCEKFYSASIQALSGSTILNDAVVTINDELISENKINGKIVLNNLHGENIFKANLDNYTFEEQVSSARNTEIVLVGKFDLGINIITDNESYEEIKLFVNDNEYNVTTGRLDLQSIELNSVITILTDNYFVDNQILEVTNVNDLTFNLFRFYTLNLSTNLDNSEISKVKINIGTNIYSLNTNGILIVENLYGENSLELVCDGYKFDDYIININNKDINAVAKRLFNVSGKVVSGDLIISNATIKINELELESDENGNFSFYNLFEGGKLVVTKQGYNESEITFGIDNNNIIVNLTYDVNGTVVCGDNFVSGVEVICGDNSTITNEDGTFSLKNLQGYSEITFEKEYYNITSSVVNCNEELEKSVSYNITGLVTDSTGEKINNLLIILNDVINDKTQTTYTQNGKFDFINLTSEYILTFGAVDFTLKPGHHPVEVGGEYNFSNLGYGFSGRVMCGNTPVGNVKITAGDKIVTSDEQGYYSFAIITKPTTLNLFKQGYTFENNNLSINEEFDARDDVNFNCSYMISGKVVSGNSPLKDVSVSVNNNTVLTDDDGNFELYGLRDAITILLSKHGYTFTGENITQTYKTFNFNAYYVAKFKVVTGEVSVSGVELNIDSKTYVTNEYGIVEINNAEIGKTFTLNKQGYNFTEYTLNGFSEDYTEINCSYNLTGIVYSGPNVVENCTVNVGELTTKTNAKGEFSFNNLVGSNVITYALDNFQFENNVVNGPVNLEVYAKYSVTGVVKVGDSFLSNVVVKAGRFTTTTNGAGRFEITGLTTRVVIELQKEGYEFEGNFEVNSPCNLEFNATYSISGYVKSGLNAVEGVLVTSSLGGKGVFTNQEGYYQVKGQAGIVTLTFEKDGYKTQETQEINSYINNLDINLSYSVVVNFSGIEDYSGVFISVNGVRKEYSTKTVTIDDLTGSNNLKFSKTGYSFTPSEYGVDGYIVIDVSIVRYYEASFTVVTDNGIIVDDVVVQVGTKNAEFIGNGKYVANELSNKVNVFVDLLVNDEQGNSVYSKRISGPTIDSEGSYNIVINNNDYAYFMFIRAYQRLRETYAYKVSVKGSVIPNTTFAGPQKIGMTYKKVGDERLYENLNYGNGGAGIEPKVSVLTYTNLKTKNVKYEMVKGSSVKDNLTANYNCNWTETDYRGYQSTFGISPEGFFPYNITNESIKFGTMSNLSYNNNQYQFTIQFGTGKNSPANNLVIANYRTLMQKIVEGQSIKQYNYVKLTFTFNDSGNITSLLVKEQYIVVAPVIGDIDTDGEITYTYTTSNNTSVNKIDISSNDAIRRTINESLPSETRNAIKNINLYILNKRREIA